MWNKQQSSYIEKANTHWPIIKGKPLKCVSLSRIKYLIMTSKQKNISIWIVKLLAASILLQTLPYKFFAAPESIYIFSELGLEPWGRIGIGIMELIAAILLIIPSTTVYGAILGLGLMSGALFFHLSKLGIEVQNDSGNLFMLALIVFASCIFLIILEWNKLLRLIKKYYR
jgi:uncharacterized membrane protein YphA (DoxX/SURF4 family)